MLLCWIMVEEGCLCTLKVYAHWIQVLHDYRCSLLLKSVSPSPCLGPRALGWMFVLAMVTSKHLLWNRCQCKGFAIFTESVFSCCLIGNERKKSTPHSYSALLRALWVYNSIVYSKSTQKIGDQSKMWFKLFLTKNLHSTYILFWVLHSLYSIDQTLGRCFWYTLSYLNVHKWLQDFHV